MATPGVPNFGDINTASDAGDTTLGAVTINSATGLPRRKNDNVMFAAIAAASVVALAFIFKRKR